MIYLDTSAFLRLAWREAESAALASYLTARQESGHVSSKLLVVEARRAAARAGGMQLPRVDLALEGVSVVDVSDAVVESASRLVAPALRSLDAIHLATALLLGEDVDELITYHQRLATVAAASGLQVASPS